MTTKPSNFRPNTSMRSTCTKLGSRKRFFSTTINPSFIYSKAATCDVYNYLTEDYLPRERRKGRANAMDMATLAMASQDFDVIHALREINGRPRNTLFVVFWGEIKTLLESHARVGDRRHGEYISYPCVLGNDADVSPCY